MELEQNQLQVDGNDQAQQSSQTPQPAETQQPAVDQKPAETTTPEKTQKTYTEEEVARIREEQAAARREAAQARQLAAQLAMQQEIARLQQEEEQAKAKDMNDVESGLITQEEANQRAADRQKLRQLNETIQKLTPHAEQLGRIKFANDVASELEKELAECGITSKLDVDALIQDESIKTPLQMREKAEKMARTLLKEALRKAKVKPETFDQGPGAAPPGPKTEEQRLRERYPTMFKNK